MAIIWALYCNVTRKYAGGKNGVALFSLATSLLLWLKYGFSHKATLVFTSTVILQLLVTGAIMGAAYAAWDIGIIQGNMTLLATASYFTPVFSAAFASLWLGVDLTPAFWQGVIMVCAGSLICWWFTQRA
ncbi:MAG: EamA family transporter [Sodalis sp. (in: enterobacteria)]|uniref:hypothetical protein n=1 Tax=Sodalis sp. (in: enterobacteria) TaxID=1898979 RepID=UPI003F37689B